MIPIGWKVASLTDYVFFQEGPGLRKWQWTDTGMKVINVTNILGDGSVDTNNTSRYISMEEYESRYKHFAVEDRDVVVASSGNTYGKVGRISRRDLPLMMNTSVIRFHPLSKDQLDDDYLYGFLRSPMFHEQIEQYVVGSAQPNFGPSHLKLMQITVPPLPTQHKIAAVLSAYDDLIENNTRRIQILEEMARALYREWFVEFRFPGYENVPMVETEHGRVPQGWSLKRLADVAAINVRTVKKGQEPDPLLYVDIASVTPGEIQSLQEYTWANAPGRARRLVTDGDIIWSCVRPNRRSFGLVLSPPMNMVVSTGFVVISAKFLPFTFLYQAVTTDDFVGYLTNTATGAAYPAVTAKDFETAEIVVPVDNLAKVFHENTEPIHRQIKVLQARNLNLHRTRDLLLPKLVSGEVEVSEMDITTSETAA
jgi:type I restriction enzyme, S subunit